MQHQHDLQSGGFSIIFLIKDEQNDATLFEKNKPTFQRIIFSKDTNTPERTYDFRNAKRQSFKHKLINDRKVACLLFPHRNRSSKKILTNLLIHKRYNISWG